MAQPILQFGTSRFLQAHVDLMISEALQAGQALGGITVVQSTFSPESSTRLAAMAQARGFPVHIRGLAAGQVVDRQVWVDSVREALHAQARWSELLDAFAQAEVVVSNTADTGFELDASDDAALLTAPHRVPNSYPAKLLVLLHRRWQGNPHAPLTICPTELVARNGDVLRGVVTGLADRWRVPRGLRDYLEERCIWVNSLVDRIVSAALRPAGAVAEPYALWAVESREGMRLPCAHADLVVTDDLSTHERLKLFVLNLGHTWLAEQWLQGRAGSARTVLQAMHEPLLREGLEQVWDAEVMPVFEALGLGPQARAYVEVVRERLCNPFLEHALSDIAGNHAQKKARRVGALLELADSLGVPRTQARLRQLRA